MMCIYMDVIPVDVFTQTEYSKTIQPRGNGFHYISAKKKV